MLTTQIAKTEIKRNKLVVGSAVIFFLGFCSLATLHAASSLPPPQNPNEWAEEPLTNTQEPVEPLITETPSLPEEAWGGSRDPMEQEEELQRQRAIEMRQRETDQDAQVVEQDMKGLVEDLKRNEHRARQAIANSDELLMAEPLPREGRVEVPGKGEILQQQDSAIPPMGQIENELPAE